MKITKKMALFVMSIGLLFMSFSMRVSAEENPSNVAISAVIPDNQIDKNKTYFDLLMTPGEEQELEVVLTNSSDEAITMESSVNSAITNDNGVVDYSQAKPK